jgi:uncharacterized protein YjdB
MFYKIIFSLLLEGYLRISIDQIVLIGGFGLKLRKSLLVLLLSIVFVISLAGIAVADTSNAPVFIETFDDNSINQNDWATFIGGSGPIVEENNQGLEITIPGYYEGFETETGIRSQFKLTGDFDIQVDYQLIEWPSLNGVRLALRCNPGGVVERTSWSPNGTYTGEGYCIDMQGTLIRVYPSMEGNSGKLRLVRNNTQLKGYYHDTTGAWIYIGEATVSINDVNIGLDVWTNQEFMHKDVKLSFDNLMINYGTVYYPVTGVILDQTSLNLAVGDTTATLAATVMPENATNKGVIWSSSNDAVATVAEGVVTPVAAGTATITVTTSDGSFKASCTVSVSADISGDFTDANFKQAVWEWLGNEVGSTPGEFTQADLSARMAVQNYTLDVEAEGISSLAGLENFAGTGLRVFDCRNNQIGVMPALPASLTELYCAQNSLGSLPALPAGLIILGCGNNQLTSLPALPDTLTELLCFYNDLTKLPKLANTALTNLYCANNQLNSLPALPENLNVLWCFNNNLSTLPALPAGLTELRCYYNNLSALPTLPPNLVFLACANNQLTSLPALPGTLTELLCFYNDLTELPELANTALTNLYCANNQLNSLPALPASLNVLWCFNNNLSTLPNLPEGLTELKCAGNQLTDLPDLAGLSSLLSCEQNYLNVFTGYLSARIGTCLAGTKTIAPQFRYAYNGSEVSLDTGGTQQISDEALQLEQSSDGTSWTKITTGNLSDFSCSSSDESVAIVDSSGIITAQSAGTCNIYARYNNINSEYTTAIIPVRVAAPEKVITGITVNPTAYSMEPGDILNITATANYSDGSTSDVTTDATYRSSNRKVATVDSSGVVTGVGPGFASITVKYSGFTAYVNIEVVAVPVTSITLNSNDCIISVGLTYPIEVTAYYSDGSSKTVTSDASYKTSNRKVATVSSSGVITGIKPGTAVITVKYNGFTEIVKVTVN